MKKHILYILILFLSNFAKAQIADGTIAPNFVATDTDGESHELYSYLQDGHSIVIYFMATWSDPCWNYHNGADNGSNNQGALITLHNEHSVDNGGNVVVLMIEGDPTTNSECLIDGPGCNLTTHGNWAQDTPFPVINSDVAASLFEITSYPTVMTICPNGYVKETGTLTAQSHWQFISNINCPDLLANDAAMQYFDDSGISCDGPDEIIVDLVNIGANNLTSATIVSEGGTPEVNVTWTGNLETFASVTIDLGVITPNEGEELIISILESDDNLDNNSIMPAIAATESSTHIHLELQSDTYPEDFSFHIYDENGVLVVNDGSWGPLGADALIIRDYTLPDTGCYQVVLYDSYGDGLFQGAYCCAYGIDNDGNDMDRILDIGTGPFSEVSEGANVNELIAIPTNTKEVSSPTAIEVFPNPASGTLKVAFELPHPGNTNFEFVNALGDLVYIQSLGKLGTGSHTVQVDLSHVAAGAYQVFINCEGKITGTRVIVQ